MNEEAFKRISSYYDDLVNRHGHDPRACDYGRPESQSKKFAVLAGVTPLDGKRLLDVGCGFADYADYLSTHGSGVQYSGVDLSYRMIEIAHQRHLDLDLRVGNILDAVEPGQFNVVNANGIFYLLGPAAADMMQTIIQRLFELAGEAVAFNSLSTWASQREPDEYYADPIETFEFCRTLTPWVVLRHDYLPHDFTIYMYRQPHIL
jgi:SAM-dependent methyltransferase